ncbi:c-type cytochrome [Sphingomonas sp. LR60]|uniref:c-type cytochrome n=1 Tax=Sphingomonas sp. LR60 TaxID=3050233 RepID=UPI002FE398B4
MIERVTRYSGWLFCAAALTLGSGVVVRAQGGQRDVWNGVYTAEQSARGKVAYAENCAACHGDTLAGIDVAPALAGALSSTTGPALPRAICSRGSRRRCR